MGRGYLPEFHQRALASAREGRQVKQAAADLTILEVTLPSWLPGYLATLRQH